MTITPEEKAAWVTALRSGNYNQGKGTLYRHTDVGPDEGPAEYQEQHCCLGVLVEVLAKSRGTCNPLRDEVEFKDSGDDDGLCGLVYDLPQATELWKMNDGEYNYETQEVGNRSSFEQIADWIEENM